MSQVSTVSPSAGVDADAKDSGLRSHFFSTAVEDQVLRSRKDQAQDKDDEVLADMKADRPTIKFHPDAEDHQVRTKRLADERSGRPMPELPEGFPAAIEGARAWTARDTHGIEDFLETFSPAEVAETEAALNDFKGLPGNNGPDQMSKELFPLPSLGAKLERISKDLHDGRGIAIIRGLTPAKYSASDNILLFTGLASYLGSRRGAQDRFGNMLSKPEQPHAVRVKLIDDGAHLTDMSFKFGKCSKRTPTFTSGALPYHTDVCDILAMYIQDLALNGGESLLSPGATVYNQIAKTRPDVIKTLSDPIWIYDKDTIPENWNDRARPILFSEPNHGPFFCFSRQKITGSEHYPLSASLPPMTEEQAEALDLVHFIAEEHGMRARLERGDILLYNNLALLHGREAFRDVEPDMSGEARRRHILRLWVRNEELAWQTPQHLAREWHQVYGDSERRSKAHWRIRPEDTDEDRVVGHKFTCS